jgi:hypothetical protein
MSASLGYVPPGSETPVSFDGVWQFEVSMPTI